MEKYITIKEVSKMNEVPFEHAGRHWIIPFSYTVSMEESKRIEAYENQFDENHSLCWTDDGNYECIHNVQMVLVDTDVIEKCQIAEDRYLNDNIIVPVEEKPFVMNVRILGLVDEQEHTPEEIVDHFLKRI